MMPAEAKLEDMADLKDLKPLAEKLNKKTDALNTSLSAIQEGINGLRLGVEAWLEEPVLAATDLEDVLDPRDEQPTGSYQQWRDELGYGRHGDGWALLVRRRRHVRAAGSDGVEEWEAFADADPSPLLGAARRLRISSVPLIPRLLDVLQAEAAESLKTIEQAKTIADSLGSDSRSRTSDIDVLKKTLTELDEARTKLMPLIDTLIAVGNKQPSVARRFYAEEEKAISAAIGDIGDAMQAIHEQIAALKAKAIVKPMKVYVTCGEAGCGYTKIVTVPKRYWEEFAGDDDDSVIHRLVEERDVLEGEAELECPKEGHAVRWTIRRG